MRKSDETPHWRAPPCTTGELSRDRDSGSGPRVLASVASDLGLSCDVRRQVGQIEISEQDCRQYCIVQSREREVEVE